MKLLIITFIFSLSSCTKWANVESTNGLYRIDSIDSELFKAKNVEWKVGKKRGAVVSKGFNFKITIPKIKPEDSKALYEKYGIDSWLYKISRKKRGRTQRLGLIQFDLANISRTTTDITVHVFYHAASVSAQFRRFHCPAFNHRLLIEDVDVISDKNSSLNYFTRASSEIRGRVTKPAFAPVIFSGGRELVGTYFVELALFNSKAKKLFSKFERVGNTIEINGEIKVSVPSCIGIKEEENPLPSSKGPSIRDLEIK